MPQRTAPACRQVVNRHRRGDASGAPAGRVLGPRVDLALAAPVCRIGPLAAASEAVAQGLASAPRGTFTASRAAYRGAGREETVVSTERRTPNDLASGTRVAGWDCLAKRSF